MKIKTLLLISSFLVSASANADFNNPKDDKSADQYTAHRAETDEPNSGVVAEAQGPCCLGPRVDVQLGEATAYNPRAAQGTAVTPGAADAIQGP